MNSAGAEKILFELREYTAHMAAYKTPAWPHPWRCEHHIHRPHDCFSNCDFRQPDVHDALYQHLRSKYGEPIGSGRHRITFKSNRVVIKMPRNMIAIHASQSEFDRYKRKDSSESDRLARCRMVTMYGVPVIVMELLDTNVDYRTKPNWSWEYDSGQCGKDRKGKWKAYDYTTI